MSLEFIDKLLSEYEPSPPRKGSSCSPCRAGPSTGGPRAAGGYGGGRRCTRGHS